MRACRTRNKGMLKGCRTHVYDHLSSLGKSFCAARGTRSTHACGEVVHCGRAKRFARGIQYPDELFSTSLWICRAQALLCLNGRIHSP